MFFTEEPTNIEDFFTENYFSLQEFQNELSKNKNLVLKGHGHIKLSKEHEQEHDTSIHLININDNLYGILCSIDNNSETSKKPEFFIKISKISEDILSSYIFSSFNDNQFSLYETELIVDSKIYDYTNEYKILISKYGIDNISLYISIQANKKDNLFVFQAYPTIKEAIKEKALKELIAKRFALLNKT
jgi:hypothetical protein